jgi:hypothetical protein
MRREMPGARHRVRAAGAGLLESQEWREARCIAPLAGGTMLFGCTKADDWELLEANRVR